MQSHPSWVRGLKLQIFVGSLHSIVVAPLVGAWIETIIWYFCKLAVDVAPLVGAWIETKIPRPGDYSLEVAPLVGAWIETMPWYLYPYWMMSHPSWVRGLKPLSVMSGANTMSRTPRGCVD